MKKIDLDLWTYKNFFIQKEEHPQLIGKYVIFKNDENVTHIDRCYTLKEARQICKDNQ